MFANALAGFVNPQYVVRGCGVVACVCPMSCVYVSMGVCLELCALGCAVLYVGRRLCTCVVLTLWAYVWGCVWCPVRGGVHMGGLYRCVLRRSYRHWGY